MTGAVDHGSQDHVVDRRDVVDRPSHAHRQQLAAKLCMEIRFGKPLAGLADQFRRLPEGLQPDEIVGDFLGFLGARMHAQRLDLLRELITMALELGVQAGSPEPGGHGHVVSQRDSQIREALQFQALIAGRQLVVDGLDNRIVRFGLLQLDLELVPREIRLPAVGRIPGQDEPLVEGVGSGLDFRQRGLDIGRGQRAKLRSGCLNISHRGGLLRLSP